MCSFLLCPTIRRDKRWSELGDDPKTYEPDIGCKNFIKKRDDHETEPADEIPATSFKSIRYERTALDFEGIRPSDNGVH